MRMDYDLFVALVDCMDAMCQSIFRDIENLHVWLGSGDDTYVRKARKVAQHILIPDWILNMVEPSYTRDGFGPLCRIRWFLTWPGDPKGENHRAAQISVGRLGKPGSERPSVMYVHGSLRRKLEWVPKNLPDFPVIVFPADPDWADLWGPKLLSAARDRFVSVCEERLEAVVTLLELSL